MKAIKTIILSLAILALLVSCSDKIETRVITLYPQNGNAKIEYTGEQGSKVTLPAPYRKYYSFVCWYDSTGNQYAAGSEFAFPSTDSALYGRWQVKLTFEYHDGRQSLTRTSGTSEPLSLPIIRDAGFEGWFDLEGKQWNDNDACPNEDMILCARWQDSTRNALPEVVLSFSNITETTCDITFNCDHEGDIIIYYTLDGSTPSLSSSYCDNRETIQVQRTSDVKAMAYISNAHPTSDATIYIAKIPTPVISTPFSKDGKVYVKISNAGERRVSYSLDGTAPTSSSSFCINNSEIQVTCGSSVVKAKIFSSNALVDSDIAELSCDHNWDDGLIISPTSTEQGYTLYTCHTCSKTKSDSYTPKYTITYNANGGEKAPSEGIRIKGFDYTISNVGKMARTGYDFVGWNTKADGTGADHIAGSIYSTDDNLTLYAKWDLKTYTITYNSNNSTSGNAPSKQTKFFGVDISLEVNSGYLARTGYDFVGWNTKADGTGTDYSSGVGYSANASLALYAKWATNSYTITYNANDAESGTAPASQSLKYGIDIAIAKNVGKLARIGYDFTGWNTKADGTGSDYSAGGVYSFNSDQTLYAKWTALPTYEITYIANGGDNAPPTEIKIQGIDCLIADVGLLARTGYDFAGWNTKADGSGMNYSVGAVYSTDISLTLYAKWVLKTYAITYNSNDATSGVAPSSQTKTYGIGLTLATNTGLLTMTGYDFAGWNTKADGTGTDYIAGATYSTEADLALYAKWVLKTYAITYNSNDATSGVVPSSQTKTYGIGLTLATNTGLLTRIGYDFVGWNTKADGTGTDYSTGVVCNTDAELVLYAKWTLKTYSVTFDSNSSTSGSAPTDQTKSYGTDIAIAANTEGLTRTGYDFIGWNTKPDGTGTDYIAGATYSTEADLALYAKWILKTYAITYNSNNSTSGLAPSNQIKAYGTDIILATNTGTLARTGYDFTGWNTKANGTGTDYVVGAAYGSDSELILYAKWVLKTYAITYNSNDATSGVIPSSQTKTYGIGLTLATNTGLLTRTGYDFVGWNTKADGTGTDYSTGVVCNTDAELVLYAKWTLKTYTVTYNSNDATSGIAPVGQIKTYGTDIALATNTGELIKTGYDFAGWNTKADGTGTDYIAGATYTTEAGLALYAKWILKEYAITYLPNNSTSGTAPSAQTKSYGTEINLASNSGVLARTGYDFDGWNTKPDGTGTDYESGSVYTGNSDLTLYAKWDFLYLKFSSDAAFTLSVFNSSKNWDGTLEYSLDGTMWTVWDGTTQITTTNNNLYMRGSNNSCIAKNLSDSYRFVLTPSGTNKISCAGNIEALLDYITVLSDGHPTMGEYCFAVLFKGCTALTSAPELPATQLSDYCYESMFYGCTSLTTAPELPALSLKPHCYGYMFSGCASLAAAPELPAATLASYCYSYMFSWCTSLSSAPELHTTTMAEGCYNSMFNGCTSLLTPPELPATTLVENCYCSMFCDCTSLQTPPKLPATTLADSCYICMFNGCYALSSIPELVATSLAPECYAYMFKGSSIKISTTQTGVYQTAYRIPSSGTGTIGTDSLKDMFSSTDGTSTVTPDINTTYYTNRPVIPAN